MRLISIVIGATMATAFCPPIAKMGARHVKTPMRPTQNIPTTLFMSDVPSSDSNDWKNSLPPSPEDQLIMTGDILALFVYSFLDHTLNEFAVEETLRGNVQLLDPLNAATQTPVWFDALHSTQSLEHLMSILSLPQVFYSPIISTAGAASVLLTSCWLLSGWLSGAFLFRNTLECQTSDALLITAKTWLSTCCFMVLLAFLSNHYMCGDTDVIAYLTKADADYIFDSLTVLLTWRFLVSYMLGYGKK